MLFFITRILRVESLGAIYHILSRVNGKENIFEANMDRQDSVKILAGRAARRILRCLLAEINYRTLR